MSKGLLAVILAMPVLAFAHADAPETRSSADEIAPVSVNDVPIQPGDVGKAESGDLDAAYRVALYYGSIGHYEERRSWLVSAAERGSTDAQYALWFLNKDEKECSSQQEALHWLRKSAAAGHEAARKELEGSRLQGPGCAELP